MTSPALTTVSYAAAVLSHCPPRVFFFGGGGSFRWVSETPVRCAAAVTMGHLGWRQRKLDAMQRGPDLADGWILGSRVVKPRGCKLAEPGTEALA